MSAIGVVFSCGVGNQVILIILLWVPADQGKLEKLGEFEWSGKDQGKILFWE